MNNFVQRSISAIVYALLFLGSLYFHPFSFLLFLTLLLLLSQHELYTILFPTDISFSGIKLLYFISSLLFFLFLALSHSIPAYPLPTLAAAIPLLWLMISIFLFPVQYAETIAMHLFGMLYPASGLASLFLLQYTYPSYSPWIFPACAIALTWINDTFAYLTGLLTGKHPLYKSISPKKTWEGWSGGLLFTVLAGIAFNYYFFHQPYTHWIIISLLVVITATIGDLIESKIKRDRNLKDSGSIMPGHGGILDRLDSIFLTSPTLYVYLSLFNHTL